MLKAALASAAFLLFALPAHAELPATILDHDYAACMGDTTAKEDPQRARFCLCIVDGEKSWTLDSYGQMAMEAAQAKDPGNIPLAIKQLSQDCIQKVLGK